VRYSDKHVIEECVWKSETMENELQRITNQGILERMLRAYWILWSPALAQELREYHCAQTYPFTWFGDEQQRVFLDGLNNTCAVLFARNLRALCREYPALFIKLRQSAERVACVVENIVTHETLLKENPRAPHLPVRPIVMSICLLSRCMRLSATPTMERFLKFAQIIIERD
jgi:hypothetical protein